MSWFRSSLHWLICVFFIATPFNPYIGGVTLYLWLPLTFVDVWFWRRLSTVRFAPLPTGLFLIVLVWLALIGQYGLLLKFAALCYGTFYFLNSDESLIGKLVLVALVSALVAIVQFAVYMFSPAAAYVIGPTAIAHFLWGELATPTFTNQFEVYFLPRMSGLSREAGFFATTLVTTILLATTMTKAAGWRARAIVAVAMLFSLSKATLMLLLIVPLLYWRRLIDRIPRFAIVFLFILAGYLVGAVLGIERQDFYKTQDSLAHRFSSSLVIRDMTLKAHLFGCGDEPACIEGRSDNLVEYLDASELTPTTGVAGVWVQGGLVTLLLLLAFATLGLSLSATQLAILCVLTITTSPLTMDGFIYMTYLYLMRSRPGDVTSAVRGGHAASRPEDSHAC